jgi:hypothetical protein
MEPGPVSENRFSRQLHLVLPGVGPPDRGSNVPGIFKTGELRKPPDR